MPVRAIGRTNAGIAFIRSDAVSDQVGSAAVGRVASGAAAPATGPGAAVSPSIPANGQRDPAGADSVSAPAAAVVPDDPAGAGGSARAGPAPPADDRHLRRPDGIGS